MGMYRFQVINRTAFSLSLSLSLSRVRASGGKDVGGISHVRDFEQMPYTII